MDAYEGTGTPKFGLRCYQSDIRFESLGNHFPNKSDDRNAYSFNESLLNWAFYSFRCVECS
jgi:hypothetical protein